VRQQHRALQRIRRGALERVVDHLLGAAQLIDPPLQVVAVLAHQLPALVTVRCVHRLAHLFEAEADVLASHDQRHSSHIAGVITPPSTAQPARRQQSRCLPVPEHVGRQPELVGELADAEIG
jgi:hypothetical protein